MSEVRIRNACAGDRDAIEAVTIAAYQQYAVAIPMHWEAYRANILATLADPTPEQIVAERGNLIVGSVLLYPPGGLPAPEVRLLAVKPAVRGGGIGVALMHECIARVRRSGASELTLHTADIMEAAMRLYERLGFQRAPELDFDLGPEATVKGYRLRLGSP